MWLNLEKAVLFELKLDQRLRPLLIAVFVAMIAAQTVMAQDGNPAGKKAITSSTPTAVVVANPSLDVLLANLVRHEQAYLPYDIKVQEHVRWEVDVSEDLRRTYLTDSRNDFRQLVEYGHLKQFVWFLKQSDVDYNYEGFRGRIDLYSNGNDNTTVYDGKADSDEPFKLFFNDTDYGNAITPDPVPLLGPLAFMDWFHGTGLSDSVGRGGPPPILEWDGSDAKLTIRRGTKKLVIWLSRAHDWHPVKLQSYYRDWDPHFGAEWEARILTMEDGTWRINAGVLRRTDVETGTVRYSNEFVVLAAEYGDAVLADRFTYVLPPGAEFDDETIPTADQLADTAIQPDEEEPLLWEPIELGIARAQGDRTFQVAWFSPTKEYGTLNRFSVDVDIHAVVATQVDGRAVPADQLMDRMREPVPLILVNQNQRLHRLLAKLFRPETLVLYGPWIDRFKKSDDDGADVRKVHTKVDPPDLAIAVLSTDGKVEIYHFFDEGGFSSVSQQFELDHTMATRMDGRKVSSADLIDELAKPIPILNAIHGEKINPVFTKLFIPTSLVLRSSLPMAPPYGSIDSNP